MFGEQLGISWAAPTRAGGADEEIVIVICPNVCHIPNCDPKIEQS